MSLRCCVEQIIGRERRERVSHHDWSGDGFVKSRRRVNSTVIPLLMTMKIRTVTRPLLIALLFAATSCSFTKSKQLGESAVTRFHNHFNAGEFHEIYIESDEAFQKWGTEATLTEFLSTLRRKLGTVQNAEQTGWHVNTTTNGTIVTLGYDVDFSEGKGTETLNFLIKGDKALLYKYDVDSQLLITR